MSVWKIKYKVLGAELTKKGDVDFGMNFIAYVEEEYLGEFLKILRLGTSAGDKQIMIYEMHPLEKADKEAT